MRLCLLITWIALTAMPGSARSDDTGPAPLQVMLQGTSAADLMALVSEQGGRLTHYLPVIEAVGAELSRAQLDAILATGRVQRHIDDLSVSGAPETEPNADPKCDVGGALELEFEEATLYWQLFNKIKSPALVEQFTAQWPPELGRATSLRIADKVLTGKALEQKTPGELSVNFPLQNGPSLAGDHSIALSFGTRLESPPYHQSDFILEAAFRGGCEAKTIPGYDDNENDFYYSTVAGADSLHLHGVRGQGVTVAILDSGLWEHPALAKDTSGQNRILTRYDAIKDSIVDEAFDESGHGTHLTSVLAHSGSTLRDGKTTGSYKGIAPDVRLVAVKAFNVEGQGDMLDIVRGIQWVLDNRERYGIRILNLSFASRPRWPYWLDPVNQAVMRAWAEGIVVIAAAGNEGPEAMSVGSPGNVPYIITVGAVTDSWTTDTRADDYVPDFSSRGPTPEAHIKPDVVAPGGHITGITRPGSSLTLDYPEYLLASGDFVMTGSSQAAALVSGLTALLLQLEPDLAPDEIKCKLTSSAEPAIMEDGLLAYSPFQQGHGYINVVRAVTLGRRDCGNVDLDIHKDLAGEQHFEGPATVDDNGQVSLPGLDRMLTPTPPEKGMSKSRVWGVKAHVERLDPDTKIPADAPFDWFELYDQERAQIERLSTQ